MIRGKKQLERTLTNKKKIPDINHANQYEVR